MRVNNYIKEKKITLSFLNLLCEYLYLNELQVNSKITSGYENLFNETLKSELFDDWYKSKRQIYKSIELQNADRLISCLYYNSTAEINQISGLRIINSLKFYIKNGRFSEEKGEINYIIHPTKDVLVKIKELKKIKPFRKPTESDLKELKQLHKSNLKTKVEIDPYENFHFGGLSGEEANTAYWNCD
jgi:hypothetical protein